MGLVNEVTMQDVLEFIFGYFLRYPGAFVRWAFTGFKRPWKEIMEDDEINAAIGMLSVPLLILLVIVVIRSI